MSWSGHERNCAFLNCRGQRFANVSAVSGLDFLDDARSLALVDWDHDGDLDIWLGNRTAPRLRLMRNETPESFAFVAIRLQGDVKTTNRDAVGARVSIYLKSHPDAPLMRTLHAGDGFLSQSSKWLSFGLGGDPQIERVEVRWPGGRREEFSGVEPRQHYVLREGAGRAVPWTPPRRELAIRPGTLGQAKSSDAAHVILPSHVDLPQLVYTGIEDRQPYAISVQRGTRLVNLFASWCAPCATELEEFALHADRLREAKIDILALSVDGLQQSESTQPADAKRLLDGIAFPFRSGVATEALLDKLDAVQRFLFDRRFPVSLPTSFLLDQDGRLVAIYRGPVSVDVLLRDAAKVKVASVNRRQMAAPLPGRWYTKPQQINLRALAKWFEEPFPEEAERLLKRKLEEIEVRRPHVAAASKRRLDFEAVESHRRLAVIADKRGRLDEAAIHCRAALAIEPVDEHLRFLLIKSVKASGNHKQVRELYRQAIRRHPGDFSAHYQLATLLQKSDKHLEAIEHLREAIRIRPDSLAALNQLGLSLGQLGEYDEAIRVLRAVVAREADHLEANLNLASAVDASGQPEDAIVQFRRALEIQPDHAYARYKLAKLLADAGHADHAIVHYKRLLEQQPSSATVHNDLALAYIALGQHDKAVPHLRDAFRLDPRMLGAANNLAWILATHPDAHIRDGDQALRLARQVCQRTKNSNPALLDTLAAAHAETGLFKDAVASAERAIVLATSSGDDELVGHLRDRLLSYRQNKPHRDAP